MFGHTLYLLFAASLLLLVPAETYAEASRLFVVVGAVGLWRYSWALTNLVRALWYRSKVFPRMRAEAEAAFASSAPAGRAFFLVTTYGVNTAVTARVYRALLEAAAASPMPARIVASIVNMGDQRLIASVQSASGYGGVDLEFVRIPGTGKRDALACGLAAIASYKPGAGDVVILVDGDSCVPLNIVKAAAPFFAADRSVGALTTDELCEAQGGELFRKWYELRFAQRHLMMCSMGLARRVLTLTGRMSVFRGDLAANPDFIETVRNDEIRHWRLGNIKFLTGDDKSTWFWLLKNGYRMLYLPDVQAISMEQQPRPGFVESARVLMVRWFGNMFRNNGRALRLPIRRMGFFTWWSILDQRVSMWTTLTGPIGALLGAIFVDPVILLAYAGWVMLSRYVYCLLLQLFRPGFDISYPALVYFNQIYGSLIKSWVFFRPDRQRWTRQQTQVGAGGFDEGAFAARLRGMSSGVMHAMSVAALAVAVSALVGFLPIFR